MNLNEKVTQWVEYKIGKILTRDIEKRINSERSSINIEGYSQAMFEEHFLRDTEAYSIKSEISDELRINLESDDFSLMDSFSQCSSDEDQFDYQPASLDDIILELQNDSEDNLTKALKSLETRPAEELVVQTSWTLTRKKLQDLIKTTNSEQVASHVLEIFRRFLSSNENPKVVCDGFHSLAETISFHVQSFNLKKQKEVIKGNYDFEQNKWLDDDSTSTNNKGEVEIKKARADIGIIFKSMWLLVQSQKGIPLKWSRFNEKRLREIVFSFIQMLSSTRNLKNNNDICGLEILSVLDPKAEWCSNWCHGATGRSLLCDALKTERKTINALVDFVVRRIKNKEIATGEKESTSPLTLPPLIQKNNANIVNKTENLNSDVNYSRKNSSSREKYSARFSAKEREIPKGNHSAPSLNKKENYQDNTDNENVKEKNDSDWLIKGISKELANEAKFCHCLSMVVYLIQYKGGRSLFPLDVTSRKRRMTIPDFVTAVLNYINELLFFSQQKSFMTDIYKEHMLKLVHILKSI